MFHVPISAIPLLYDPPFVLALLLLATALGFKVLRTFKAPIGSLSRLEKGLFSAALGLGLLQYLPFTLGSVGALTPRNIAVGLIIVALLLLKDLLRIVRSLSRAIKPPYPSFPRWIWLGFGLLAIILLLMLPQALCPAIDQDGVGYHLAAPKRWLKSGDLHYLPTLLHTNAPMGVEMLYTIALAVWSDTSAKLIHFMLGVLAAGALFALGRRLRNEEAGFTAAALWLCGLPAGGALTYFSLAFIDLGVIFQVVMAVFAWVLWFRSRGRAWLLCAALCAGFAVSFKLTAAPLIMGLAVLTLLEIRQDSGAWKQGVKTGGMFLCLALLPVLPWLMRTWIVTGNPVYPLLAGLFPTRDWSPEASRALDLYFKYYNLWGPVSWGLQERILARGAALLLTVLLTAFFAWHSREREIRPLILLAGWMLLFGVYATGLTYRLLLPATTLAILLAAVLLSPTQSNRRWAQAILGLIVVSAPNYFGRTLRYVEEAFNVATGQTSRQDYLHRALPITQLWDRVNSSPEGGAVLVAALQSSDSTTSGLGFYCDRNVMVTDAYLQNRIRMDTWERYLSDIQRENIRFVIAPLSIRPGYVRVGPEYAPARNEYPFARRLVEERADLLQIAGNYGLYRLR
jgi:hypothetical protein